VTTDLGVTTDVAAAADPRPEQGPDSGSGDVCVQVTGPHVTAVVVARDGAAFLPRALAALAGQTHRPDAVVGVDAGSRDDSADLLAGALPLVVRADRRAGFSRSVDTAAEASTAVVPPEGGWLWLLHDDCAPRPDALARLLAAVETAPSVALAGCKQVDWDDDQRILDVGVTTTRGGARVPVADRDEVDQGQHDARSDVLAVGTAGLLVRRDVWARLGGADPTLAHARDELDLGRRAHLAGHRVVVVPAAVVAHASAWAAGRRPGTGSWWRAERRDALQQRLAAAFVLLTPVLLGWALLAAVPRAVFQLVMRRPGRALDELLAVLAVWARPDRWIRSRWRARRTRAVPRRTVRSLYASRWQLLRARRDDVAAWIVPASATTEDDGGAARRRATDPLVVASTDTGSLAVLYREIYRDAAPEAGPTAEEAEALPAARAGARAARHRFALSGLVPVLAVTVAAAGTGLWRLLSAGVGGLLTGSTTLVAADLLPTPPTTRALWQAASSGWRPTGVGAAAAGDPLGAVLAALSLPLGGVPGRAVAVLLVGALPLAAWSGWLAAGAITRSRAARGWAGLVWAACPPLLGAVGAGRVGAVLAHVTLPLAAAALARAVGLVPGRRGRRGSLHAGFGAGLLLTVLLAAAPGLAAAAVVAIVAVTVLGVRALQVPGTARTARTAPAVLLPAVAAAGVPALLLLPWWVAVAASPRLLLADPDLPGATTGTGTVIDGFLDGSGGVGRLAVVAALAVAVPVLLLGLGALLRRSGAAVAAGAWVVALAGLATALLAVRTTTGATGAGLDAGRAFTGRPGPGLSLLALGATAAAVAVLQRGRSTFSSPRAGRAGRIARAGAAGVLGALVVAGPLGALAAWSWHGVPTSLRAVEPAVLPPVAAAEAEGVPASRTLVTRSVQGRVSWTLARAAGPRLGDDSAALASRRLDPPAGPTESALVTPVLAALLGDGGQDIRPALADLGVGYVQLLAPVADDAVLALDASPGLVRVSQSAGWMLWRVDQAPAGAGSARTARARLLDASGAVLATLPSDGAGGVDARVAAAGAGRVVRLAERADDGWTATLDGRDLVPGRDGWAQTFALPPAGGRLVVRPGTTAPELVGTVQGAVLAVAVLGLLPLPRLRRRLAPPGPPAPSRPVTRVVADAADPGELPPMPQVFDEEHPEHGEVAPLFTDEEPEPGPTREVPA